jgi:hypothetical protein
LIVSIRVAYGSSQVAAVKQSFGVLVFDMTGPEHAVRSKSFWATADMKRTTRVDQGPSISVGAGTDAATLLRFDCYAIRPHYHYEPGSSRHRRVEIDAAAYGEATAFALRVLRHRFRNLLEATSLSSLPALLASHDHERFMLELDRAVASLEPAVTVHDVQGIPFDLGPVRLFVRSRGEGASRGITFHFTRLGEPGEFLCLDCFGVDPHYHYEPLRVDIVRYLDTCVVPDAVAWGLEVIASGRVLRMFADTGNFDLAVCLQSFPFARFTAEELRPCVARLMQCGSKEK